MDEGEYVPNAKTFDGPSTLEFGKAIDDRIHFCPSLLRRVLPNLAIIPSRPGILVSKIAIANKNGWNQLQYLE